MSYNHCSSENYSRNLLTHLADKLTGPCSIDIAVHIVKNLVCYMLQRNIHIAADLWIVRHLVKHIFRECSRIRIMYPYPLDSFHLRKFLEKFCQCTTSVKIQTIICSILGDDDQLTHAAISQFASLLHKSLHWY